MGKTIVNAPELEMIDSGMLLSSNIAQERRKSFQEIHTEMKTSMERISPDIFSTLKADPYTNSTAESDDQRLRQMTLSDICVCCEDDNQENEALMEIESTKTSSTIFDFRDRKLSKDHETKKADEEENKLENGFNHERLLSMEKEKDIE